MKWLCIKKLLFALKIHAANSGKVPWYYFQEIHFKCVSWFAYHTYYVNISNGNKFWIRMCNLNFETDKHTCFMCHTCYIDVDKKPSFKTLLYPHYYYLWRTTIVISRFMRIFMQMITEGSKRQQIVTQILLRTAQNYKGI